MGSPTSYDLYSPGEIALAAGVPEADVLAALGGVRRFVGHADAVRLGRQLVRAAAAGRGRTPSSRPEHRRRPARSSRSFRTRRRRAARPACRSRCRAPCTPASSRSPSSSRRSTCRPAPPRSGPTTAPPIRCGLSSSRRPVRAAAAAEADCCRRRRRRKRFAKGAAPSAARCRCAGSRNPSSRCPRRRSRSPSR